MAPRDALEAGLVTSAPDEIDWDDEVRLAVEARAAITPDAMTGLEASLRFAGPETIETKIFGRLSAWQNWIFPRPNSTGEKGALRAYGDGRAPGVRLERRTEHVFRREDPEQRRPVRQQAPAARARALAAEVPPVVARHGAAGVSGLPPVLRVHRDQRRSPTVGALRGHQAAGISVGISSPIPCTIGHRLRRFLRPAGVEEVPGEFRNQLRASS